MRHCLAPSLLALALLGCAEPSFKPERIQLGMTEEQVLGLLGKPTATTQLKHARVLDYETFDQDRWFGVGRKENVKVFSVRLEEGRVSSAGPKDGASTALPATLPAIAAAPAQASAPAPQAKPVTPPVLPTVQAAVSLSTPVAAPIAAPVRLAPSPAAFDLRAELEKLEKLKQDGLISAAEYQDLRQNVLKKAKQ